MPNEAGATRATAAVLRIAAVPLLAATLLTPAPSYAAPRPAENASQDQASGWDDASRSALLAALADRSRHGLDRVSFLEGGDGTTEAALSQAALRFAGALARGLVDPTSLHDPFTLSKASVVDADLKRALAAALAEGRITEWLAGLAPQDDEYMRLSRAYLDLRTQPQDDGSPALGGKLLKVGDSDPRVPAIAEQLAAGGYLPAVEEALRAAPRETSTLYTQDLADAVERLQRDFGIAADGVIGPETVGVLNLSAGDKTRALAVGLERRRWLSRTPPPTRIDVNTAAARLRYYRDGVLVDTRRVVVGKSGTETPLLQSPIYRLVANPTWTVPKSIQNGELANVGADYLAENNMTVRNGWIVQGSGPQNALGMVKFDMINKHAIYLHDTSAPELFDRSQRHRSHGCVRVEDALGFAQMLAQDQGVAEQWEAAQAGGEQQFVPLKSQIPVRLMYRNVFIGNDGAVAFRTDPYGWNVPIAKALGFQDEAEFRLRSDEADIAP